MVPKVNPLETHYNTFIVKRKEKKRIPFERNGMKAGGILKC